MSSKQGQSARTFHGVEVVSVPERSPLLVMFLGPYYGLLVHWDRGRNHYCPGHESCPPTRHKIRAVWKGYAPVDVWDRTQELYLPMVLEITERLEHQIGGRVLRGEIWSLKRGGVRKNKEVIGQYTETKDPSKIRNSFDIKPVLQNLYHVDNLDLGIPNPMPPKVMLEAFLGEAPEIAFAANTEEDAKKPMTQEEREKLVDEFRKARVANNGRPRP